MSQPEIVVNSDVALGALNDKETAFVLYVVQNPTHPATKAAAAAGWDHPGTRKKMATRLMKRPKVQLAIQTLRREISERAKIDAIWVLKRLSELASIDIQDMFNGDGTLKDISDMPEACRKAITTIETQEIFSGQGKTRQLIGHAKKIKIIDPLRTIELIGKHIDVNAFRPDINIQAPTLVLRDYTGKDVSNGHEEIQRIPEKIVSEGGKGEEARTTLDEQTSGREGSGDSPGTGQEEEEEES